MIILLEAIIEITRSKQRHRPCMGRLEDVCDMIEGEDQRLVWGGAMRRARGEGQVSRWNSGQ